MGVSQSSDLGVSAVVARFHGPTVTILVCLLMAVPFTLASMIFY